MKLSIIGQLKKAFPKIQFVATTHSPFLIQQTDKGELIKLLGVNEVDKSADADDMRLDDIIEDLQEVGDSLWSVRKRDELHTQTIEFYNLLDELTDDKSEAELNLIQQKIEAKREELTLLNKDYNDNIAYTAFLEQKKLVALNKMSKIKESRSYEVSQ